MYRNVIIDSAKSKISSSERLVKGSKIKENDLDYFVIKYNERNLYIEQAIISKEIVKALKKLYKKYKNEGVTLIVGLGNSSVIGDSLGPTTLDKLIATNQYEGFITIPKVVLFKPEVISKTGISSFNLIKMIVNDLKPTSIIFIDSLKSKNSDNLDYVIEINDSGIIPGSSINTNKKIDGNTFGIPVISMGIPLFFEINKKLYNSMNIKEVVNESSEIIAAALNKYFFS